MFWQIVPWVGAVWLAVGILILALRIRISHALLRRQAEPEGEHATQAQRHVKAIVLVGGMVAVLLGLTAVILGAAHEFGLNWLTPNGSTITDMWPRRWRNGDG